MQYELNRCIKNWLVIYCVDNWRSWLSSQQCAPCTRQHLSRVNLRQQRWLLEDCGIWLLYQQLKHPVTAGRSVGWSTIICSNPQPKHAVASDIQRDGLCITRWQNL